MRRLILPLLVLLSLTAAACGGDEGLTVKEYKAEAKKICQGAKTRTEAIKQPTKASDAAIVTYFNDLLKVNERTTQQFTDLEPPETLESEHKRLLDTNKKSVAEVRRLVGEIEGGKENAREVIQKNQQRLTQVTEESNTAIKALDVPECGR